MTRQQQLSFELCGNFAPMFAFALPLVLFAESVHGGSAQIVFFCCRKQMLRMETPARADSNDKNFLLFVLRLTPSAHPQHETAPSNFETPITAIGRTTVFTMVFTELTTIHSKLNRFKRNLTIKHVSMLPVQWNQKEVERATCSGAMLLRTKQQNCTQRPSPLLLHSNQQSSTPFVVSTDGLLGEEARALLRKWMMSLSLSWQCNVLSGAVCSAMELASHHCN